MTLRSTIFGAFDPLDPAPPRGAFGTVIASPPQRIAAPRRTVWSILMDFEAYPEWNPFNRYFRLRGMAGTGASVVLGPSWGPYDGSELPPPSREQHEVITTWVPGRCLGYAVVRPWLEAERIQHVRALEDGTCEYRTYERMAGAIAPLVDALYRTRIVAGFEANGRALARRAEARHRAAR